LTVIFLYIGKYKIDTAWAKKLHIFNSPYWCNRSRENETDFTKLFTAFKGVMIQVLFLYSC